jgi:hypothetical protein
MSLADCTGDHEGRDMSWYLIKLCPQLIGVQKKISRFDTDYLDHNMTFWIAKLTIIIIIEGVHYVPPVPVSVPN